MKRKKLFDKVISENKHRPHSSTASSVECHSVLIAELAEQCRAHERDWAKLDVHKLKVAFAKYLFFDDPLFAPPHGLDGISIRAIRRQLWDAMKYRDILYLLGNFSNRDDRLYLIARWLKQENVCEPEEIITPQVLHRLARKTFPMLSTSNFHHAERVRAWLPYFECLLGDFHINKGVVEKLVALGYEETAVRAARRKRSAISAACDWLATPSSQADALTLRNAYSRIYKRPKMMVHAETHKIGNQQDVAQMFF